MNRLERQLQGIETVCGENMCDKMSLKFRQVFNVIVNHVKQECVKSRRNYGEYEGFLYDVGSRLFTIDKTRCNTISQLHVVNFCNC